MNFSSFDHHCMAAAIRAAGKGLLTTHPNPRVGCVIARGDQILGIGWHQFAGGPHAEIMALAESGNLAHGTTAFVTLEPCNHQGRTAPCVDALLQAGVSRVVVASLDPNPIVNGKGIDQLRQNGITVDCGLMATQAEELNVGFFKRMREGRPWVRVKTAMSLDGRIALLNGDSKWISCEESRRDVQAWRARSSAILTGIGTVLADDPSMNVRLAEVTRQPIRVIADSRWRTPLTSRILADPDTVLLAGDGSLSQSEMLIREGINCLPLPAIEGRIDLVALMTKLADMEINEIQVEAGAELCGALLSARLVDEWLIYQAPVLLGDGGRAPFQFGPLESMEHRTHFNLLESVQIGNDIRLRYTPQYRN